MDKCNKCDKCIYFKQGYDYWGELCAEWCEIHHDFSKKKCHYSLFFKRVLRSIWKIREAYYNRRIDKELMKDKEDIKMDILSEPKQVTARKEHKCDFCDKIISIGEEHTVATYKQDYIYNLRTCNRCKTYVEEAISNKAYDWTDGLGWDDFHSYMHEEHKDVATEWWK